MRAIRLRDDHADRPDVLAVPVPARWLHVVSLMWARRQLDSGGVLTLAQARALARAQGVRVGMIAALVREGLWVEVDGGYTVKDLGAYLEPVSTQRTREWRKRHHVAPRASSSVTRDQKSGLGTGVERSRNVPGTLANGPRGVPNSHPPVLGLLPELPMGDPLCGPCNSPVVGELVAAPDYVAAYVDAAQALGVSPIPATKARVGKAAKELAGAGKHPAVIVAAIQRLVAGNRPPTALPYLVADLEREEAGHSSGGRRLPPGAQQTEEFIQRVLARRHEAAS